MKSLLVLALLTVSLAAKAPKIFDGLFTEDTPVRAHIGLIVPPAEIENYLSKVNAAARKNPEWFEEFTETAKPGSPLPFHENLGLTKEEYDEYIKLWDKREFKPTEEVVLILRKTFGDSWTLTATGEAGAISTLRYDQEKDIFRSPNGELERLEDIKAEASSILGAWSGFEWRFEEETSLGMVKENFAIGRMNDKPFGLVVYRAQELSSSGRPLLDKSMVIRFALGKAGHIQIPTAPQGR